jgi:hypothetical protein
MNKPVRDRSWQEKLAIAQDRFSPDRPALERWMKYQFDCFESHRQPWSLELKQLYNTFNATKRKNNG